MVVLRAATSVQVKVVCNYTARWDIISASHDSNLVFSFIQD
jgi:hypothetical protein